MDASSEITQSDWPLPLMLDEVWLRARRVLVHRLETESLWSDNRSYQTFMKEQKARGEKLKAELLQEVLGHRDYAWLSSETIFGATNQRFRTRLPFVVAFGYELGASLYGLLDGQPNQLADIAELCAVFNLGISVFDLVYDNYPDLFAEFSAVFNETTLHRLEADAEISREIEHHLNNVSAGELRVLLKLIIWFFAKLHALYRPAPKDQAWEKLLSLLLESYRAELRSASIGWESKHEPLQVSRAKSSLPFAVINQVAILFARPSDAMAQQAVDSITAHLALNFWLADDLADIVRDFQAGALNSILVQAMSGSSWSPDPSQNYPVLARLLEGSYIEQAASELLASIISIVEILEAQNFRSDIATRLNWVILSYTRNWME